MPHFPSPFDLPIVGEVLSKRPLVFADVGAAGGIDPFLRSFIWGDRARFFGFEPHPEEFAKLKSSRGIQFLPIAISDREGETDFFLHGTSSSIEQRPWIESKTPLQSIKVPVRTLVGLIDDGTLPGVDAIKVDAEGHDLYALRGAGRHLSASVLLVKTEFSFSPELAGSYFAEIDKLLTANGLSMFGMQYYTTTAGVMGSGDAVYLRSVESIIHSDAPSEIKRERVLKLIALSYYLRNLEYAYVVARAASDFGILSGDDAETICSELRRSTYLPNAIGGAAWLDPVVHFLFAVLSLLAGRRGRDKSLPKSNRLVRYRIMFLTTPRFLQRRARTHLDGIYEDYQARIQKNA